LSAWPELDQKIWARAQKGVGRFDKLAPMAELAQPTIDGRAKTYGAMLMYMKQKHVLDIHAAPSDRVTPDFIYDYIEHMRERLRASSIKEEISRVISTMGVLAPNKNWSWIKHSPNAPTPAEIASSKKHISPPDPAIVIDTALKHFDEADAKPRSVLNSVDARDGLMIAFAVLFALRRKNLQEIQRGEHLLEGGSTTRLLFESSVKNGASLLFDVPDWMMDRFNKYLKVHRPRLLDRKADHLGLWVSRRGTHLSPVTVAINFNKFGVKKLGRQFKCHLMRHAMANTIIVRNPGDSDLAAAALGHNGTDMVEQVYSKSATIELSKTWIRKRRRRVRHFGVDS
jgi:integrase